MRRVLMPSAAALGAEDQWVSFDEDDDCEPLAVSVVFYGKLQLHNLEFLSRTFKVFGINTWHSLGHRTEKELYEKALYILYQAQGHPVGTMSRVRELLKNATDECTLGGHLRLDTAPAPVSNKLWARLTGRGIERLLQVLVTCDVLSYEALSMLNDTEFEQVCMFAGGQGF
jgi:hypothetical protein